MKIISGLAMAIIMTASSGYCAGTEANSDVKEILSNLKTESVPADIPSAKPAPAHHDWDNNFDSDHHHPPHEDNYHMYTYNRECAYMNFTAQSPTTAKETLRFTGKYPDGTYNFNMSVEREITAVVGARELGPKEKEFLEICLDSPDAFPDVKTDSMLYNYDYKTDGWGEKKITVTLTPKGRKEGAVTSVKSTISIDGTEVRDDGSVWMTLKDSEPPSGDIEISLQFTRTDISTSSSIQDLLGSMFKVQGTFEGSDTYTMKIMDTLKPGQYIVTIGTKSGNLTTSDAQKITIE